MHPQPNSLATISRLSALSHVARNHGVQVDVTLAEWFDSLTKAVERDGMQGDVWRTIRIVCATHIIPNIPFDGVSNGRFLGSGRDGDPAIACISYDKSAAR